jgi:4-amino-4-deoxy-L-arabinose transferase-like glycosyltransferase
MRFELDHDWQGNMATPQAKMGERAKTHLLISLCAIWIIVGLIGHQPWKPLESNTVSIIKTILVDRQWLMPSAVSQPLVNPPLYYWSAAVIGYGLSGVLPLHDGARLASGLWMVITLLMVGMAGRELWGKGIGRQTTFVFIGSLGLVLSAHTLTPFVSSLSGVAAGFYGLALSKRRPYRASLILGTGIGVSFLSTGLLPVAILVCTAGLLAILFSNWRSQSYLIVLGLSLLIASPFLLAWPMLCYLDQPLLFSAWWQNSLDQFSHHLHAYFLNSLLWYAWPSLPLAIWGLWRYRSQLHTKPRFQLSIVFFLVALFLIGLAAERKEIYALPLLIPLTAIAGGSIETIKRGAAGALNWFGLILFGLMSVLIWSGWTAMMTGNPAKLKERILFLTGLSSLPFNFIHVLLAAFISLIWLAAILRVRHTNRAAATNWAIGITCVWTLLMTLWLPLIDDARSYDEVFSQLKMQLPQRFACVTSRNVGDAQRDLLHYYAGIKALKFEEEQSRNCDLYLIQDEKGREKIQPGAGWHILWSGKRRSERSESFRLYQHD